MSTDPARPAATPGGAACADAPLGARLSPCGPLVDAAAADRTRAALAAGWTSALDAAWPALAPVAAAASYLAGLLAADAGRLSRLLETSAGASLEALLEQTLAAGGEIDAAVRLRRLKGELHLLVALADLGGVWSLEAVTDALSRFADAAVRSALAFAAAGERAAGRLLGAADDPTGPAPGLFVLAMGKHGAGELNYSSDIDISVFYAPEALPLAPGAEPERAALRLAQAMAKALGERTADGYVFRTDLRLRPDPASTPVAVPVDRALAYYESVGQNWERAALIKARPVAGDLARAQRFLRELTPFVWRRALDYAAIADIQSIVRQIQARPGADEPGAAGADLKLGVGGIRAIEFYVQTQQLILGGRHRDLRSPRTRDALAALAAAGHVADADRAALDAALVALRGWEHRVQMRLDEQTHRLPEADAARAEVAALAGRALPAFDAEVAALRADVAERTGALFADAEPLASPLGPLVFTGVEDDAETLRTLARMGFAEPQRAAAAVRGWHHGRINATRTPRGRELFTRLAPRLLAACAATGAADVAFARFGAFFAGLGSGVQVQSLLLAQPRLFALLVRTLALSPRLADVLARRPAALDALLDEGFFAPLDLEGPEAAVAAAGRAHGFEGAMDAVRRAHRDEAFRIGMQALTGEAAAPAVGRAFARLADACLGALAPAALAEVERLGGAFPGEVAVIALGKFGGREMTAGSDLDLMTLHRAAPDAVSAGKGWGAETVYGRFTQRLAAALSAPTAEGDLYAVDLQLRPSGTAGPVSTSLGAFCRYHGEEAQTWEALALTRARVAWASSPGLATDAAAAIEAALRRPRDRAATASDVRDMRALMARERPARGRWDLKLASGGLVDIEFAAQHLQIVGAAEGGPLDTGTAAALSALRAACAAPPAVLDDLAAGWALQAALQQVLRLASDAPAPDLTAEPVGLVDLLCQGAGAADLAALERRLAAAQAAAHAAYLAVTA